MLGFIRDRFKRDKKLMPELVVLEEIKGKAVASPESVARAFGVDDWLKLAYSGGTVKPIAASKGSEYLSPKRMGEKTDVFYRGLFDKNPNLARVFRVRNPVYPLHDSIADEMRGKFPAHDFDYVLSVGEAFGLDGFFVERLSPAIMKRLEEEGGGELPTGCFNGMHHPRSGRHWFSREAQDFYLVDCFEELFDSPRSLIVNAMPGCNYRCPKCPFHSPLVDNETKKRYGSPMSVDNYARILERAKEYKRLSMVSPTISGEALAHPYIVELVRLTHKAGFACGFTTNAALLDERMTDRLIEAGIGILAFSVDAVDQGTYAKLQGNALAKVESNILTFRRRFIERHGSFLGTMSFVVSEENQREIEMYKDKWLSLGFQVIFYARHDWQNSMNPFFRNNMLDQPKLPCPSLWHSLFLSHDFTAIACGRELVAEYQVDAKLSFLDSDPFDFWRSQLLRRLRDQMINETRLRFCAACTCWSDSHPIQSRDNNRRITSTALGSNSFFLTA